MDFDSSRKNFVPQYEHWHWVLSSDAAFGPEAARGDAEAFFGFEEFEPEL